MENKKFKHVAELALIISIPGINVDQLLPSRTKGLLTRLYKETVKDLGKTPKKDPKKIEPLIQKFGEETGWEGKSRHISTLLSFCADMIECSENKFNPRILEAINDLIARLERGKELKAPNCWAGSIAADKWEQLFVGD